MTRKVTSQRKKHEKQKILLHQWTAPAPFQETEYPFEPAIEVGSFSEVLQLDMGSGIRLYPSTIRICRQDTSDSLLLTKIGEQFREFYPDEMPWMSTTEAGLGQMIWQDESDDVEDSLT